MMMAVPAMLVMANTSPLRAQAAISALAIYIGIYLFMNLGAFAIVFLATVTLLDISSSKIRRNIKQGKSIQFLVPERVSRYIGAKGLYRWRMNAILPQIPR